MNCPVRCFLHGGRQFAVVFGRRLCLRAILPALFVFGQSGNVRSSDRDWKFFENKVRPLLANECYECHGAKKTKGNLRLDHISHILKGGDTGPALVPGNAKGSLIIEAVQRTDPDFAMPPKSELTASQVAILEKWISDGAPWPPQEPAPNQGKVTDQHGFRKEDYQWWAVQPVSDPQPPQLGKGWATAWAKNDVDRFVARKLKEKGLKPAPEATRPELIRRAFFDLIGLPPSPERVAGFVDDPRPDAWERLVEELLASPHYGERWAQHWLDVARYAESDGYRADDFRKETWRYRDYVIRSFNKDKPYDQFIREQIAGDEIAPGDYDALIATGFLRLGIYEWNQRNARMQWDLIMTEMTNVTGEAFLGLGIGCAQCHDHKFDPILQRDHFALQAFLNTVWWPENRPVGTAAELVDYQGKLAEWEEATAAIRSEIQKIRQYKLDADVAFIVKQFPDDIQKIYDKPSNQRTAFEEQLAQLVQRQVDNKLSKIDWNKELPKKKDGRYERYKKLTSELSQFDSLKPKPLPFGFIATDIKPQPADTLLKKRTSEEVIEPAFLTLLGEASPRIEENGATTGRRTALANWIADPKNPLSTRVIVNRVWQRHFAAGLAPSPNDFGKLGGTPTHPELLDWLASRFLDNGWRLKHLHRFIMTSAAYRQTARREPGEREKMNDPGNTLLWRYPPKRLQAEQVRDSILALSGELDKKEGGPSVSANATRRTVYTKKMRNSPDAFLANFDAPAGFSSAPGRTSTTTPLQSLLLVNGEWPLARARAFAKRILGKKERPDEAAVRAAFQLAYAREPAPEEVRASLEFIRRQSETAPALPKAPAPKYPNETGLRPAAQHFAKIKSPDPGSKTLWLQPGSRFQQLDFSPHELPGDAFTIEAVANLDAIHRDASVNTLVSKWNGSKNIDGWTFGVTSAKSRYEPRNFIMQLVGKDFQDNRIYEVVASNLRFPLQKPVYFAAAVSAVPTGGDVTAGKVVFYMKDLSDSNSKLQRAEVAHSVVGGFGYGLNRVRSGIEQGTVRSLIGGRDQPGHLWDGQLARISLSRGVLPEEKLLIRRDAPLPERFLDWNFSEAQDGEKPAPGTSWRRTFKAPKAESKFFSATVDFCHTLLNSNEFLYLH